MSHPPMRWDELNGFWATVEEVRMHMAARERVLLETNGRVDIFATSATLFSHLVDRTFEDDIRAASGDVFRMPQREDA